MVEISTDNDKSQSRAADDTKIYDVLHRHRYKELDGLRGIAALAVGIHHGLGAAILIPASAFGYSFIANMSLFVNGDIAVDLFFIMSGFFLAGMLENLRYKKIGQFYLRRFVRLVPPAFVAVVLLYLYSVIALSNAPTGLDAPGSIKDFYTFNHHMSFNLILLNLALIRHTLNPPLWTIRLELFTSVIFPAIFFLKNNQTSLFYRIALFCALFMIALLLNNHQKLGIDVFHYLYIFYAGILVRDFGKYTREISNKNQYILFFIAIFGLALVAKYDPTYGEHPILFDLPATGFGTILVTLLAFGNIFKVRDFMNSQIIQFLGRISYSFYLINWLGAMSVGAFVIHIRIADHYGAACSVSCAVLGTVIVTFLLSCLLHITIEQPATAFSRNLGKNRLYGKT